MSNVPKSSEIPQTKGFTLVELILVAAILAVMASFALISFQGSQDRARDTKRKTDLKQYQIALERYGNSNSGFYPIRDGPAVAPDSLCPVPLDIPTSNCPEDPRVGQTVCSSGTCEYLYLTNSTGATEYSLWARLERPADDTMPIFIVCSTGITGESASAPTAANLCPL